METAVSGDGNNLKHVYDNKLKPTDRPVQDWYRFVLSFPPHLVRNYIARFGADSLFFQLAHRQLRDVTGMCEQTVWVYAPIHFHCAGEVEHRDRFNPHAPDTEFFTLN